MDRATLLQRVRVEHRGLREHLDGIEELARQVQSDESRLVGNLRSALVSFRDEFRTLLVWEERDIAPLLEPEDVLCRVRLLADGLEISRVLEAFESQALPPQMLARRLTDLAKRVRQDVAREEACLLHRDSHKAQIGAHSTGRP